MASAINNTGKHGPLATTLYQVVKTVYASPSRVNFQLDSKKASVAIFVISLKREKYCLSFPCLSFY